MAFLTNTDVVELTAWRRHLHQMPELSGEEAETAAEVEKFLSPTGPDLVLSGLGGHGVALVYDGAAAGPTLLFRAELDALPIEELGDIGHKSRIPGKAHLCGHDGHTAILAAMARGLGRQRPRRGRIVLMFQPAEETGAGAAAIVSDPVYASITPDYAFSLHNLPGLRFGHVALKPGPVNCASRGMRIVLEGKTAHASMPETGTSPMAAISSLMPALTALSEGNVSSPAFTLVTVTHAEMGAPAFGVAPAHAEIWATLRTLVDDRMAALSATAEALVTETAATAGLRCGISYHDIFRHCENDAEATQHLRAALDAEGMAHDEANLPIRASEDFGRFGDTARSAMLFLGAGENHPALHNPDYDFPDELIGLGARIFMRTARMMLG